MNAAIIFGLLFALMLTGMPISISLGLTVLTFLFTMTQVPIESVGLKLFSGLDNFGIMAIPFFILAGTFLTRGGVARRMIAFTTSLVGHFPGGLGLAGVAACAMFAAISGSSVATVVAIGSIMMPAMVAHGYPRRFGVGVISTSGALGILVPPSIILVLYGVSTNTSIGALFMAGIVPGIILALMLAAVTFVVALRNGYPKMPRATLGQQWNAFRESLWGLLLIGIVLGGIYGGIFTPTEAAGVAAIYSIIVTMFIYRDIGWRQLWQITLASVFLISQILIIVTAAGIYSWLLTTSGIPQHIVAGMEGLHLQPWQTLLLVNLGLLLVGSFLEPPAAIMILTPLLLPLVQAAGVHPVHFGIIMAVNLSIGMYTPPFGLNLFASQAIFKQPLATIYRGVVPFVLINFATLMLISYVPSFSMALVNWAGQ
jgi:C4-dicarboxylate transporter DctM subunit